MDISALLDLLLRTPAFRALLEQPDPSPQALVTAARPFVVAGLYRQRAAALVLIAARSEVAQQLADQIEAWLPPRQQGGPPVYLFAEPDALPYERIAWSNLTRQRRMTALAALQSRTGVRPIVVASARSLMQKTLPPRELRMALRQVRVGGVVRLEQMAVNWAQTGYTAADVVEEPASFARRGGIVDIWPPNLPHPVRIDLFGDEVDSLRVFDPATQRTEAKVESVEIGPGCEALSKYGPAALERLGVRGDGLTAPENLGTAAATPLLDPTLTLAVREELRREVEHLRDGQSFHGVEWYLPYFYARPASLLDHVAEGGLVVVDDAGDLFATLHELTLQAESLRQELIHTGELPHGFAPSFFTVDELRAQLSAAQPLLLGAGDLMGKVTTANTALARSFAPGPRYGGKAKQVVNDVAKLRRDGHCIVLASRQAPRLTDALQDADIVAPPLAQMPAPPLPGTVSVLQAVMADGFTLRGIEPGDGELPAPVGEGAPTGGSFTLHFYTDSELFGWNKPRPRRRTQAQSTVAPEIFFADVKAGEFVVHLEHGVGVYDGLVKVNLGGMDREYLQVSYARGDKLYVPVHQADRLSRYVGAGEKTPMVNRLGTADWGLVKERARRAVADIADELLLLYAERETVHGHAFSPDGPWQEELETSFPYQETDDQLTAADAVKRDMEADRPMDRLICGDVGYGKTEVAVRAAFKAMVDGKQVALLVPTTVLAQQHFRTLSARLSAFPIKVEMLSRFRTPAQQARIVQGVADGSVDLVVGTHRLLSQDLQFKDLGLLIVDEEQRFGVAQKERLKQLRSHVDVLTLSATPIPRTLHMSLSGVRDMSTINTPPKERLPIHTVLAEFDELMVRQAVQRELNRGGQVFIVHNRVQGIRHLADRIQRLVPEASLAVAHGQMPERELEEVMMRFADGEFDILVATTIIENGLDIPNANTIIINRADKFGLAQLYQLRGRVGRSAQRGHCYLLYDKHTALSYDARRRLSAIMESSEELGAGFRIAMRDLEIRGAGELLGARQHGHIDSVGFDLYTRLLAQAINDARRKKQRFDKAVESHVAQQAAEPDSVQPRAAQPEAAQPYVDMESPFDPDDPLAPPVTLDLPLHAEIPQTYVAEESLRLQMYRRIAGLTHPESVDEMRRELIDRFGVDAETRSVPEEVESLFFQIKVKILALKAGVQTIGRELDQLVLRSEALENMDRRAMQRRLRLGLGQVEDEDLVPEEAARVARRAIYLPIDDEGKWQIALIRTLEIMAYS